MIHAQNFKVAAAIPPEARKDNAASTMVEIDSIGYDYCSIILALGATDIASATCKVTECATSGGTFTNVTGLIAGTSDNITGSTSSQTSTTDNAITIFEFPLHNRERFLKMNFTAGDGANGTFASAVAILSRKTDGGVSDVAADRGAEQILRLPE